MFAFKPAHRSRSFDCKTCAWRLSLITVITLNPLNSASSDENRDFLPNKLSSLAITTKLGIHPKDEDRRGDGADQLSNPDRISNKFYNTEIQPGDVSRTSHLGQTQKQIAVSAEIPNAPLHCGPSPLGPDQIRDLVDRAAQRYGVDQGFARAIAWTESRFDRNRNSTKGARGPMQLMPATAQRFDVADICDPLENIDAGMRYLKILLDRFGNPLIAAAAYNAGEQRIFTYRGVPPFDETRRYVAEVLNYQYGQGLFYPVSRTPGPPPIPPSSSNSRSGHAVVGGVGERQFVDGVMRF